MAGLPDDRLGASSPLLVMLLGLAFVRMMLGQPYNSFLPAFARSELNLNAAGLGLLTSAGGVGALLSSLVIAALGDVRHKGRLLLGAGVGGAAAVLLLLWVRLPGASFLLVGLVSASGVAADVMARTLLQARCELCYRGRVASVMMVLGGLSSLIALPAGALADRLGVPLVVSGLAVAAIVVHVLTMVSRSEIVRVS